MFLSQHWLLRDTEALSWSFVITNSWLTAQVYSNFHYQQKMFEMLQCGNKEREKRKERWPVSPGLLGSHRLLYSGYGPLKSSLSYTCLLHELFTSLYWLLESLSVRQGNHQWFRTWTILAEDSSWDLRVHVGWPLSTCKSVKGDSIPFLCKHAPSPPTHIHRHEYLDIILKW